jgi:predicted O-methyltransferase YrrM
MLYEMKMAVQLFREEGLISVAHRTWHYVLKLPRYLLFSFMQKYSGRDLDLHDLVNYAFTGGGGLIMPLQVRSEILLLLYIIKSKPPKNVLEIGTSNGGTLFLLSRVAAEDACIISIDLPLGAFGGGYPAWKRPFYKSFAQKCQTIRLIRADSHELGTRDKVEAILQMNKVDLLFIDGDHSYEGVRKDFEMYHRLVKKGGRIVFHDIVKHRQSVSCEVSRYWEEIKLKYSNREIIEDPNQGWAGLGIITVP